MDHLTLFRCIPATDAQIAIYIRLCNIQFTADQRPRRRNINELVICGSTNEMYSKLCRSSSLLPLSTQQHMSAEF